MLSKFVTTSEQFCNKEKDSNIHFLRIKKRKEYCMLSTEQIKYQVHIKLTLHSN